MCTGAFIKMYEMLVAYPLIAPSYRQGDSSRLRTVHLCEAPGGFISATNHYIRSEIGLNTDWDWKAVSLNPYHEANQLKAMIDDDRMMLETMSHWMFGTDNTGDIRVKENIRSYWKQCENIGPIQLVTGDGSISCMDNPAEQEAITSQLHYCEMVCALGLLSKGGSMVLKMFTFFEVSSIHKLKLLSLLFEQVIISKPACSKAGNSETYLVCTGFNGIEKELLDKLLDNCGEDSPTLSSLLPQRFMTEEFVKEVSIC